MMRCSGMLLPIASLPSPYGIGTLGKEARNFVDFLSMAGQSYWQILPICQTGYGDSPYQSVSSYAGNPYWIDLDDLKEEGYLKEEEYAHIKWCKKNSHVDYETLYKKRYHVLLLAVKRFLKKEDLAFHEFCFKESYWLEDYALYMTIKTNQNQAIWQNWPEPLKTRDDDALADIQNNYQEEILFYKGIQYLFFKQWHALVDYAHEHNIQIIGDTPIYVASDSADVWANANQFLLDENLEPIEVAGCPPDGFAADGQLWGNPLYDWDTMRNDDYAWWTNRMRKQMEIYDVIRLDHFRGFDSYYAIPFTDDNARNGHWCKGPGIDFFNTLEAKLGKMNIIAEDLGFLTDSVIELVKQTGYPGMKVLELGFDDRDTGGGYLPHTYTPHCIAYTGTHDNDTINGWLSTCSDADRKQAFNYCRLNEKEGYHWGMMKVIWASVSELAIIQVQDLLGLGSQARINIPSTVGNNWTWRLRKGALTKKLAEQVYGYMKLYGRASY